MLTKLAIATPIRRPDQLDHLDRGLVAVVGELGDQRADELAAVVERSREAGARPLAGDPQRLARERGARRVATRRSRGWDSCPGTAGRRSRSRCGRARPRRRSRPGTACRRGSGRHRCPVPIVSITTSLAPRAAPARCSAIAATLASLSTNTGSPSRSAMTSANGMSASGRLTATTAIPVRWSIRTRDPEADRLDFAADRLAHLLDSVHRDVEQRPAGRDR